MRCSRCGVCCHQTRMMLSNVDVARLEKAGYGRSRFARLDEQGFLILRNRSGDCFFYDAEKHSCKIYRIRPEGCRVYPVIYGEEEGVIVDDLCPQKESVSESERERIGRRVISLLHRIDGEALCRMNRHDAKRRSQSGAQR